MIKKWDERKLAYEVNGQKRGTYVIAYFTAPGDAVGADRARREAERAGPARADHQGRPPQPAGDGGRRAAADPAARGAQPLGPPLVDDRPPRDDRGPATTARATTAAPAATTAPRAARRANRPPARTRRAARIESKADVGHGSRDARVGLDPRRRSTIRDSERRSRMASYNKVILVGNLTRDPQLKYLPSQTAVAEFGLAVQPQVPHPAGEDREEVTFVDCTAFGKTGEVINQYFTKGKPIFIEGRLKYDPGKTSRAAASAASITVVVDNFQFVGGRDGGGGGGGGGGRATTTPATRRRRRRWRRLPAAPARPAANRGPAPRPSGPPAARAAAARAAVQREPGVQGRRHSVLEQLSVGSW